MSCNVLQHIIRRIRAADGYFSLNEQMIQRGEREVSSLDIQLIDYLFTYLSLDVVRL